jgi:hypothetical protein
MTKQAISITLTPDNLTWLRGRARAEGLGSLSECLDRLLTRARFGQDTARPARSMKGALASLVPIVGDDEQAIPAAAWQAWSAKWEDLLAGVTMPQAAAPSRVRAPRAPLAIANRGSRATPRRRGRG